MDARRRLELLGKRAKNIQALSEADQIKIDRNNAKKIRDRVGSANKLIKKLDATTVEDQSLLIKYRGNMTVPAVWVAQQGVRLNDLPFIPAEKIPNLNTYIADNIVKVDGGDLEAP